jgi:polyisoprenoid-binding protein YceI
MRFRTRFLLMLLLSTFLSASWSGIASAAGNDSHYILDLSDAEVGFSIDVLGMFRVSGRFERVEGGLLFSEACTAESIAFVIQSDSVNTNNRLRDSIIRSAALLNSRDYPVIAFTSTRIDSTNGGPEMITGILELNGKKRQISFRIETPHPVERALSRAGTYQAIASISRKDFDIPSPMLGTGDTVNIRVSLWLREETLRLASSATQEKTR